MSKSPEEVSVCYLDHAIESVRDMVAMFRRRGAKTEHAIPAVADLLETKPHRVRSLFYRDKMWFMSRDEAARIEAGFVRYLDREIILSIEYTAQLRVKRDQIRMRLECTNTSYAPPYAGINSAGQHARSAA